ncbi:hypothetical protein PG989_001057 [Apiospora arundinis]
MKVFNINQIVARLSIFLAKLSILLLYIRIFFPVGVDRKGTFWWLIQGVIWMNLVYTVALVLALALQCVPYGRPWGNSCMNQWLVLIFASIVNIMSRSKKWAAVSLFAFGALAPFVSIAGLVYQIVTADSEDKAVIYLVGGILATAEQVVGIIVGCLAVATSSSTCERFVLGSLAFTPHHRDYGRREGMYLGQRAQDRGNTLREQTLMRQPMQPLGRARRFSTLLLNARGRTSLL